MTGAILTLPPGLRDAYIALPSPGIGRNCFGSTQDGSDLAGTNLIERLENELVAQTAALDSLLNAGGKRGRKQAALPLTPNQVGSAGHQVRCAAVVHS